MKLSKLILFIGILKLKYLETIMTALNLLILGPASNFKILKPATVECIRRSRLLASVSDRTSPTDNYSL